eukprot:TRINITY_DN3431_c0_g1_i5.p1 TRINITY_DN3431_c0_g1~~TRINITY_DN3431_c0_g1_i5.p1  ORF type:complete len:558 (+),score=88.13 TRINITY_DN3431_c0_g1_i5:81-1676(+)
MEPAPEWTAEVEDSLAAVVATVLAAGRNAEAQPLWRFLQRGGRLPLGRVPRAAFAGPRVYEVPLVCPGHGDEAGEESGDEAGDESWDEAGEESGDEAGDESGDEAGYESVAVAAEPVRLAPDFGGAPPLQCASVVGHHIAAVSVQGEVLCSLRPRTGLFPVTMPWPAAIVSCGMDTLPGDEIHGCFAVALRRGGGSVCKFYLARNRYDCAATSVVFQILGLPPGDPVVTLHADCAVSAALTVSGTPYGWGHADLFSHLGARDGAAVRIAQLCGRRIRRLGCGPFAIAAETEEGALLVLRLTRGPPALFLLQSRPGLAFPLRDWDLAEHYVHLLDAFGTEWVAAGEMGSIELGAPEPLEVPYKCPPRVVSIARASEVHVSGQQVSVDAGLTEGGELLVLSKSSRIAWVNHSDLQPELPLGLLPVGGHRADRVLLLPDLSCGKHRLQLFARIAARLTLPSDPLRAVLLRFAVRSCYIGGPEDDPFWRSPAAPAASGSATAAEAAATAAAAVAAAAAAAGVAAVGSAAATAVHA